MEIPELQRSCFFCGLEWEWWREPGRWSRSSLGRVWVVFDVHQRMAGGGVAQRSVHFQVTHSGVYCPVSPLNDVMFHLRLLVMLKSVVCSLGGNRQWESCKSGFCKAFVCWVWRDKSWLMQYFEGKELHRLVNASCFTCLSPRWGHYISWRQTMWRSCGEHR